MEYTFQVNKHRHPNKKSTLTCEIRYLPSQFLNKSILSHTFSVRKYPISIFLRNGIKQLVSRCNNFHAQPSNLRIMAANRGSDYPGRITVGEERSFMGRGRLEDELRSLIRQRYGSIPQLAIETGVNKQTIYSVLNNGVQGSSLATMMPIIKSLELDPFELAEGRLVKASHLAKGYADVPLFGTIAAGTPTEAISDVEVFPIPAVLHHEYPNAFMLRVSGESMNRSIPNGSYALIDPCDEATASGDAYAVAVGADAATIKYVRRLKNGLELVPHSSDPTYRPIVFDFGDPLCEPVRIIGRVIWHCAPLP